MAAKMQSRGPRSSHKMGRIKTKLVKRTSRQLVDESPEAFTEKFEDNKKALGNTMPSKRLRNMIAGYAARLKKKNKSIIDDTETE